MAENPDVKRTDDSHPESSLNEGIRLYRLKRWKLALQALLGVNTQRFTTEEKLELAYYLGLCYTKVQRYEEALSYLEQVVAAGNDPLRVYQCRMALAYIYVVTKRTGMAEFELKRLASNGFESAQLYTTLAYSAWLQKHFQLAIDYYEKALDMDRNNATALNGLGYILVDSGIDLPRGFRVCQRAVELKPHNPAYQDSLGWAYYKTGNTLEARIWIRKALEASPNEVEIQKHYSTVMGEE